MLQKHSSERPGKYKLTNRQQHRSVLQHHALRSICMSLKTVRTVLIYFTSFTINYTIVYSSLYASSIRSTPYNAQYLIIIIIIIIINEND